MKSRTERSIPWIIVSGFFGILVLLLVLVALRYFSAGIGNGTLTDIIGFIFANIAVIVIFTLLSMIAEIFFAFPFPADLPGPVFSAFGILFLLTFIVNLLGYLDQKYSIGLFPGLTVFIPVMYLIIFIIVLIAGYIRIFNRSHCKAGTNNGTSNGTGSNTYCGTITGTGPGTGNKTNNGSGTRPSGPSCHDGGDAKTWAEVGAEFRGMLYDSFHRTRERINRK